MSKKKFKIDPKVWPKEYTFEEFKRLNPNTPENVLINYYHKYLQEYAENRSRHIRYFEDNKKLLSSNLQEVKNRYDDSQHFLKMYYGNSAEATGGSYPTFTPTDITGLTHWYKVEPQFLETRNDRVYNDTTNIQEIVSWSNAVGDSPLVKDGTTHSGYLTADGKSIGFFRGRTIDNGNTGGQRMEFPVGKLPSLGAFTYFAVMELNSGQSFIQCRVNTNDTGSVVFTNTVGDADAVDRTILFQESTTISENYRLVFANNNLTGSLEVNNVNNVPNYSNYFSEQVLVANFDPFMSDSERTDNKVSGSTLAAAIREAVDSLPNYTSSLSSHSVTFYKYPITSSYTGLPHDGHFQNAEGEGQTVVLTSEFEGIGIIQNALQKNQYHGIWTGEFGNGAFAPAQNSMVLFGKPIAVTGSMDLFFALEASSSKDTGDGTGTVAAITNDPDNNERFVFMVTKDASENALLKVYINNVSVFEDPNPTGSLELDELAHFTPKFFGIYDGQDRTLNGRVYEMGFYTGSLSDSDRKQLYYYLGTKHNTHNYDGAPKLKPYNWPDSSYDL